EKVETGERDAEQRPCSLVAARRLYPPVERRLQVLKRARDIASYRSAIFGACPPAIFDAYMVKRDARTPVVERGAEAEEEKHQDADICLAREDARDQRGTHGVVMGLTPIKAERAGDIAQNMFEK